MKTGETEFAYVVKTLLPTAAGTKFTAALPALGTKQFGPFVWTPDVQKFYNPGTNDLAIVAFLQNEETKEVYQSAMIGNLADPDPSLVTAVEPVALGSAIVYPVPANDEFTISLPKPATHGDTGETDRSVWSNRCVRQV